MKKKTEKNYRIQRFDGKWRADKKGKWVSEIKRATVFNEKYAKVRKTVLSKDGICELVEVGTKPSKRTLFRPAFLEELNKLCERYGVSSILTSHDTHYIGYWE